MTPLQRPHHWSVIDEYRGKYRYWRNLAWSLALIGAAGWVLVLYFITVH